MFTKDTERTDERGQVGIGTLIVFIAMVLVAAIAAGVLINTAGLLQSKSQQTGQQATGQVTNHVQVDNKVGILQSSSSQQLKDVNLTVQLAPGASPIKLNNTTISYISPNGSGTLTALKAGATLSPSDSKNFSISTITDNDQSLSSGVLNNPADRANIQFNATALQLKPGQSATLRMTTKSGSTTIVQINAPTSFSGKTAVGL